MTTDGAGASAIAACAAVLLLAGCSARTPADPLLPSPATAASPSSAPAGAGSVPSTPAAVDPPQAPGGFTVADLVGTWRGEVFVRGWDVSTVNGSQIVNPSKDTTWTTTMTLGQCSPETTCGSISYATQDAWGTGEAVSCRGSLTFRGQNAARGDLEFDETIASRSGAVAATAQSRNCHDNILVVTPLASGTTVAVEERVDVFLDYGVVTKQPTP